MKFKATFEVECFFTAEDIMTVDEMIANMELRSLYFDSDFPAMFGAGTSFDSYSFNNQSITIEELPNP